MNQSVILKGAEIMKRFLCLLLILCIIPVYALMESIDLSGYSFDDLRKLQQDINAEIKSRPEWKSVNVPCGVYTVGKDIPAGEYSISMGNDGLYICVKRNGYHLLINQGITKPESMIAHVELLDGDTVEISGAFAVFAPPVALGF